MSGQHSFTASWFHPTFVRCIAKEACDWLDFEINRVEGVFVFCVQSEVGGLHRHLCDVRHVAKRGPCNPVILGNKKGERVVRLSLLFEHAKKT